jgi:membrane-associated phospholipid phosphatase
MRQFATRVKGTLLLCGCALGSVCLPSRIVGQQSSPSPSQGASARPSTNSANQEQHTTEPEKPEAPSPATSPSDPPSPISSYSIVTLGKDLITDQERIWTSPSRLRLPDLDWFVPLAGISAGLFVTDRDVSKHISSDPNTLSHYKTLSDAGVAALAGSAAGLWALSYSTHNAHWRETGFLAGEAALDSLLDVEALKYTLRRERPFQGDGSGPFFNGGTSFPSEHAAAAWSIAGVLAHEYPGFFPKLAIYSLASLVSYSRIRGRQHFPSDVFVGGLMGQFIAQDVYSRHHDPELGGEAWRSIGEIVRGDGNLSPANQASPYVPMDSWVYPAIERLMALGAVDSAFASLRPWTRRECARLLAEAENYVGDPSSEDSEAGRTYRLLADEFRQELEGNNGRNLQVRMESIYTRVTGISGAPLGAGLNYDFGQTFINDYGRPYQEGVNGVAGFSAWTTSGRWVGYIRGEYQHAPSAPALPQSVLQAIPMLDGLPSTPPATPFAAVNRFQLFDAYAGVDLDNWQFTFGPQSLWWGPDEGGSTLESTNAVPIPMFRVNRVSPLPLPWIFSLLGPVRIELFFGQMTGQHFVVYGPSDSGPFTFTGSYTEPLNPQPFLHGEKIAFKPTPNFEFSFSRTTIMGGPGVPITLGTLKTSYFSTSNAPPGTLNDPGDRRSALDWEYRLPKLRDWVTFYGDAFADDQFSPIAYFDRSVISAGLYFVRIPKIPKLDFRAEGVYSDVPAGGNLSHGFYYYNARFHSGYTNDGNIIGDWIGREGQGAQGWLNYWITPKNRIQANYRHEKVSQQFLPGGGTITDVGLHGDIWANSELSFSGNVQYETWNFPLIRPGQQRDISTSLQVTFWPSHWRLGN